MAQDVPLTEGLDGRWNNAETVGKGLFLLKGGEFAPSLLEESDTNMLMIKVSIDEVARVVFVRDHYGHFFGRQVELIDIDPPFALP